MRWLLKLLSLLFIASSLCACATTTLKDTWRNPAVAKVRVHKLVVVSIGKKDANRRIYEEVIASELKQRGLEALAGYQVLPGDAKLDTPMFQSALNKVAAEAVLTVQTMKVERQTVVHPGTYPGYWYPNEFPSWSLYGYYDAMYYEPPYTSTYDLATIQVNLFETGSGKLIWAATLQSIDPGQTIAVSKDVARIVAEELTKAGMM